MTSSEKENMEHIRDWKDKGSKITSKSNFTSNDGIVVKELKNLYRKKIYPIEKSFLFSKFNHAEILDSELYAKPLVLLIGQYSTGKTSFIKNLIGCDYPGIHIGPEPTTDRFIAVVYGEETKTIMGNAVTGMIELPFSGLSCFGTSFLSKFSAAVVPAPMLKNMNIIDTPGVLSGEKQRLSRGYDFSKVSRWFAERSDLILLMFDCSKLDISDEFRSVIEELQPHEDKVHCILNKADQLDTESLMRVYGALLWSMGRIFKGAEVTRVYVGSFGEDDKSLLSSSSSLPTPKDEHRKLFNKDKNTLMDHLYKLPSSCSMRKINEMVKRVRLLIVQVCILGYLRSKLPYFFGKEDVQLQLSKDLKNVFEEVKRIYQLPEGDFPKMDEFRAALSLCDFSTFPVIDRKVLNQLQDILLDDIPKVTKYVAEVDEGIGREGSQGYASDSSKQPSLFTLSESPVQNKMSTNLLILFGIFVIILSIAMAIFIPSFPNHEISQFSLNYFHTVKMEILKWYHVTLK